MASELPHQPVGQPLPHETSWPSPERLLSRIVHDEKALLRHMSIYAEMAKAPDLSHADLTQSMDKITQKASQVARLVDIQRLLSSLEHRRLNPQEVEVSQLIKDLLRRRASALGDLIAQVTGAATVSLDPDLMSYALSELLLNVCHHGGASPGLEIEISNASHPIIRFQNRSTREADPSLFKPFEPGGKSEDGTKRQGLGLYLVHQIMALHGGTALLRNPEPGIFAVELHFPPQKAGAKTA